MAKSAEPTRSSSCVSFSSAVPRAVWSCASCFCVVSRACTAVLRTASFWDTSFSSASTRFCVALRRSRCLNPEVVAEAVADWAAICRTCSSTSCWRMYIFASEDFRLVVVSSILWRRAAIFVRSVLWLSNRCSKSTRRALSLASRCSRRARRSFCWGRQWSSLSLNCRKTASL